VRRRAAALLLPGLVLGFVLACRSPVAGPRPNVLLITVDTLRPDHLGCLGYARPTSPAIDSLAARGVVFRQAVTAAGRTVQSFPSILTGVIPPTHGLRYEGQSTEAINGRLTLTRALKDAGYDAFAVTQGLNVGLHRDFDVYDPDIYLDPQGKKVYVPTRNDMEATKKAMQWLRGRQGRQNPFFLWLRYNAPHWPYDPPAPYAERFDPDYKGPHTFNEEAAPGVERGDLIFGIKRLPDREVQHAIAHYDGEVAYADAAIADLLRGLDTLGATGRTIVVVTADHGESLGEHDYFFEHGAYLYEPVVRVPLIVVAPGRLPEKKIVETLGRTIDIVPTVLDLAGIRRPEGLEGVSLVPWARGETHDPAPAAYSESGRNFYKENPRQKVPGVAGKWRMMRDDRYKLLMIPDVPEPQWEFYDLKTDPGETKNVLAEHPVEADRLKQLLLAIVARDPMRNDREEPALPDDLEERLRSLGYVGGGSPK